MSLRARESARKPRMLFNPLGVLTWAHALASILQAVITSVKLSNLRGIRHGSVSELTPLTVLVGPNSAGKSTLLDALLLATGQDVLGSAGYVVRRRSLTRGARWLIWRGGNTDVAQVEVNLSDGSGSWSRYEWWDEHSIYVREALTDTRTSGVDGRMPGIIGGIRCQRGGVGAKSSQPETGIVLFDADNHFIKVGELSSPTTNAWLVDARAGMPAHELYSRMSERGQREQVLTLLRAVVRDLVALEVLTDHGDPRLHLTYSNMSVPVALAGDGVQMLVRLCLELGARSPGAPACTIPDLVEDPAPIQGRIQSTAVFLEEPEAHQHPASIRQSARAMLAGIRSGLQLVVATHSLELIDALLTELADDELPQFSVHRLQLTDGYLRTSSIVGEDIRLSRREIAEDLR